MNIIEKIEQDYLEAARAKDKLTVATLRLIKAALKNKQIEKMKELTEEDAAAVLKTEAKKRRESIEAFEAGNRQEMADNEKAELAIIEKYLPQQMSVEETEAKVKEIIEKIKEGDRDFGKVMGLVMKEMKGQADGQVVSAAVKKFLS
ncbi:MAG TPA: GatB/YqeY domain-containing protein [Candidatus Bipolaricaulota bacterium]|nr:GatB/YqeY domain-containing protein [Candidatus Bipolaricaulota bacterium]